MNGQLSFDGFPTEPGDGRAAQAGRNAKAAAARPETVEFWGLEVFEGLRGLACQEWEPPKKRRASVGEPRYWKACMNVFAMPSEADGMVWLAATDSTAMAAIELHGRCDPDGPVPIPRDALPPRGGKAASSGWRMELDGRAAVARRVSKGYTGQVAVSKESVAFELPDTTLFPDGWQEALMSMREVPPCDPLFTCEADKLARGFAAIGPVLKHRLYDPCTVGLKRGGRGDMVAYNDKPNSRARLLCSSRRWLG